MTATNPTHDYHDLRGQPWQDADMMVLGTDLGEIVLQLGDDVYLFEPATALAIAQRLAMAATVIMRGMPAPLTPN